MSTKLKEKNLRINRNQGVAIAWGLTSLFIALHGSLPWWLVLFSTSEMGIRWKLMTSITICNELLVTSQLIAIEPRAIRWEESPHTGRIQIQVLTTMNTQIGFKSKDWPLWTHGQYRASSSYFFLFFSAYSYFSYFFFSNFLLFFLFFSHFTYNKQIFVGDLNILSLFKYVVYRVH